MSEIVSTAYADLRILVDDLLDALPPDAAPGAVRRIEDWLSSHCASCGVAIPSTTIGSPARCSPCDLAAS